ncbi:MAG: hypothetical protein AAB481_01410 [Patescibacteria group bacterium]
MSIFEIEYQRDVKWSTVATDLTVIYAKDRYNPQLKDTAGTAKARGILLGNVRHGKNLTRAHLASELGILEQVLFCAEHGLAVTREGPVFEAEDRYETLKTFQLQIADHLGVNSESLEQEARRFMMEELEVDDDPSQ